MNIRQARIAMSFAMLGLFAAQAVAQRGPADPQFQRYPFDKWAAENAKAQIRWSVRIDAPRLSLQQRLGTQMHVLIAGDEFRKRAADGQILVFVRVEDSAGQRYQTGNLILIARLLQGPPLVQLDYKVSAFVLPGDYNVSLAICDARTMEHSFAVRRLHVAAIGSDPLPGAWNGLPPVEFLPETGIPDSWFLPQLHSRIALSVAVPRPVRVEILVNTTPSELGSISAFRRNMELVVPSLRVLMGIQPANGSLGLSVLDMNRRELSYAQPDLRGLDSIRVEWPKLRRIFAESSAVTVDARTLAGQYRMLDYFSGEAKRLLGPVAGGDGAAVALIVLSAPVFFTHQEKASLPDLPSNPSRRIFYISYSPISLLPVETDDPLSHPVVQQPLYLFADDIEHVLKPLGARVFRVTKPEEFRRALGAVLDEIAKMPASH